MQDLEPYYSWRDLYVSEEDEHSPFYGKEYSEFEYSNTIYNYYIHPQWDDFGSSTLYLKVLYADYDREFAILEFIGEWNDCLHNDIMLLKRDIIDVFLQHKINKFILIGENVLNYHASDDCYYQEWFEDLDDGWVAVVNFQEHVIKEIERNNLDYYLVSGGELANLNWRTYNPVQLFERVQHVVAHRLV